MKILLVLIFILSLTAQAQNTKGGATIRGGNGTDEDKTDSAYVSFLITEKIKPYLISFLWKFDISSINDVKIRSLFEGILSKRFFEDLQLAPFETSSLCRDKYNNDVLMMAYVNNFGGPICFNLPGLVKIYQKKTRAEFTAYLTALTFHELAHHGGLDEENAEAATSYLTNIFQVPPENQLRDLRMYPLTATGSMTAGECHRRIFEFSQLGNANTSANTEISFKFFCEELSSDEDHEHISLYRINGVAYTYKTLPGTTYWAGESILVKPSLECREWSERERMKSTSLISKMATSQISFFLNNTCIGFELLISETKD